MLNRIRNVALGVLLIILSGTGLIASAQQRRYQVNDRQVNLLLGRIATHTNLFRQSLEDALNQSRLDNPRREENIKQFVADFEATTNQLRDRFRNRQTVAAADVQEVLDRALRINNLMGRLQLGGQAESDWNTLRTDLNQLANYYNISWSWDTQASYPSNRDNRFPSNQDNNRYPSNRDYDNRSPNNRGNYSTTGLTGTYRLDVSRSDNVADAVDRATRSLPYQDRQRVRETTLRRLESPDTLAIEQRGRSVTIASSRGPQITFEADQRTQTEQLPNGRTVQVNTALTGNQLVISTTGDRGSDFNVTFDPIDNGSRLRVTRRVYVEGFNQPIVVTSVYDKTSDVAQLNLYSGSQTNSTVAGRPRGNFTIPDGTQLMAVLNTNLTTQNTREGERFTMTVRSPAQYSGAIIEGYVSKVNRSGRVSGRADLSLEFERIRLRNGGSYTFAGYIEGVRAPNGENVKVDNEGSVKDADSQTGRTVTRTGVGAAVGALIGAIAGGGKGAAIGAAVGAGAGAGSVFIQGRDDLELMSGTEFTIRVSAPR